ncbi:hypothetical protein FNJ88_03480 [Chryseobacterium sp. SNU WT5]|uniref:hypothetical protein n=1 Tax=Chryseobacterium sp. SNU WT5 TaxID=2594269 RepID=UPI00117CC010|nr:hypothetical protein [Chryseobacterium sp. SNU WT5]QDP84653.1 hypothetical protein FNJ88_03480 [Chryseobacterium sp. SNU WT5]
MSNRTFLLMMPDYSDFPDLFVKNLKKEGFCPYLITDNPSKFRYKGTQRIINFFHKNFKQNKDYKKRLVKQHKLKEYYKQIVEIEGDLDYALVIRPDLFPINVIKELGKKAKKLIAYQWDGLEKFPEVKKYCSLFDTFFCFDSECAEKNIKPITNFYFDCIPPVYKEFNDHKPRLYFLGLYWKGREAKIDKFIKEVSKIDVELSIILQYNNQSEIKNTRITYIKNRITFLESLKNVEKADILLDFVDPVHNGLSIRFFEAMYYKKKIITDNKMVKNYDFYNSNNIFIIDDNYSQIENFIKIPYHEISDDIVKSYSFSSWIDKIIQ